MLHKSMAENGTGLRSSREYTVGRAASIAIEDESVGLL